MARFSTGMRNAIASEYGLGVMMNGGIIRLYGQQRPKTPDSAPGTVELGQITTEGRVFIAGDDPNEAGLYLQLVSPGSLIRDADKGDWRLKGSANGTCTWWRWNWRWADPNTESTFYPRIDGTTEELQLSNTSITTTMNRPIEQFLFVIGVGT